MLVDVGLICNNLKFLHNCIQKNTALSLLITYFILICPLIKIPSRQQHMLDLLTR